MRDIDEIPFLAIFRNFSVVFRAALKKLLRKLKNDLLKVPTRCNLLKEKMLFVEIGALLLVEILFTGYKK